METVLTGHDGACRGRLSALRRCGPEWPCAKAHAVSPSVSHQVFGPLFEAGEQFVAVAWLRWSPYQQLI